MTIVKLTPQDFEVVSGNDKELNVTVLDQDDLPISLTGAVIAWAYSRAASNKTRIQTYTSPTNITIILPQTGSNKGKVRIDVQAVDTEPLVGDYYHEARMTAAGKKSTIMYGKMKVLSNIIDT
jgi:hypothetical protein